ncbi:MAG: GGDEF domain-containing protein [Planctomycetes bacterium]|nr:GGDEF domain-containing protein [Planctomycetota bacterium]
MAPRHAQYAVLAAACATGLLHGLGLAGCDHPALPGLVFACATVLIAWRLGLQPGALSGLLCAAGLLYLQRGAGQQFTSALLPVCAGLVCLGVIAGSAATVGARLAAALGEENLELRRQLYRLRKSRPNRRRPEEQEGAVTAAAPGAAAPPAAGGATRAPGAAREESAAQAGVAERLEEALRAIASSLNEPRVIEVTLRRVREVLNAERVTLHLHDRKADRFLPGASLPEGAAPRPAGGNESLLRACLRRRGLLARDAQDETSAGAFAAADGNVALAAPLFDRAMLAGVLLVSGVRAEAAATRAALSILATAAGLALATARLAAIAEEQERRDPLTGLAGVGAIRQVLGETLARGPAAVLLAAASRIRDVNEAYGRKAGDRVVAALSRVLALEVGKEGTVGRYGGATFLVVLPGHGLAGAQAVGERLRRRVPASVTAGPEGLASPLRLSVGAAAASLGPAEVLLQEAERALAAALEQEGSVLAAGGAPHGERSHA